MQAVRAGPLDEVRELLEAGADTNMRDAQGNTALHKAAIAGSVAKAQLLVEHGANLELHNRFGRTALHEAANVGWPEVCGILVRLGAEAHAKDGPLLDGQTYGRPHA
jgi:ankyrin repeat protein